jgi:hypothetical protein
VSGSWLASVILGVAGLAVVKSGRDGQDGGVVARLVGEAA